MAVETRASAFKTAQRRFDAAADVIAVIVVVAAKAADDPRLRIKQPRQPQSRPRRL